MPDYNMKGIEMAQILGFEKREAIEKQMSEIDQKLVAPKKEKSKGLNESEKIQRNLAKFKKAQDDLMRNEVLQLKFLEDILEMERQKLEKYKRYRAQ